MSAVIENIVSLAQPFADWYGNSPRTQIGVSFLHFAGLLTSGGFAIASDRAVLRAVRGKTPADRGHLLTELGDVHAPVIAGLALVLVTGLLLTFADPATYLVSTVFWVKMGLVALLLANGGLLSLVGGRLLTRPETDARAWTLLSATSVISMLLWLTITLVGVILTSS